MFDKLIKAIGDWFRGKPPYEYLFSDRFKKDAKKYGKKDRELQNEMLEFCKKVRSKDGDTVSKTNGCRKVRMEGKGKGKSGGYRIMVFTECKNQIHFLHMYSKNKKKDLTPADKKALRSVVDEIKKIC